MEKAEQKLIIDILKNAVDAMGSSGCNDFVITDIYSNRCLADRINTWMREDTSRCGEDAPFIEFHDGKAITYDFVVAAYLIDKLQKEFDQ